MSTPAVRELPSFTLLRRLARAALPAIVRTFRAIASLARRFFTWLLDLLSASYYAGMIDYKDINPEYEDPKPERMGELSIVVKTRGGQQYYQSSVTMSWELTWDDIRNRKRVKINPNHELSVVEAEGRNRALSVQRKTVSGAIVLFLAFVLEAIVGLDISLLTSDASDINVTVQGPDAPATGVD